MKVKGTPPGTRYSHIHRPPSRGTCNLPRSRPITAPGEASDDAEIPILYAPLLLGPDSCPTGFVRAALHHRNKESPRTPVGTSIHLNTIVLQWQLAQSGPSMECWDLETQFVLVMGLYFDRLGSPSGLLCIYRKLYQESVFVHLFTWLG